LTEIRNPIQSTLQSFSDFGLWILSLASLN